MSDIQEIKNQVNSLATTWEAFKGTNDQRLKEIEKRGSSDVLLEVSLNKINEALESHKKRADELEAAIKRPGVGGEGEKKESALQLEHKQALLQYIRKGEDAGLADLEQKALSVGSDPDGGYLVTPTISTDVTKIVYETSNLRGLASVTSISSDSLDIPEDRDQTTSGWVGEVETRSETNTPTLGLRNIPTHELYAEPRITQKLIDDANMNVEQWLSEKVGEEFSRKENSAFVTGTGVGRPRGFLTYAAGSTWGTIEQVASGTSADFDGDDIIELLYTLKTDYANNASFLMNRAIEKMCRKLKDGNGQYLWAPGLQAGQPNSLLNRPTYQASDMPVAASNSLSLAVGDFRRGYQIVDRIGVRVIRDNVTAKPFIKLYTTKRVGGDVKNFEAIKLLKLGA